jgi:UDP-2,3-diacylglucosamine pyrophosphatase LpxH
LKTNVFVISDLHLGGEPGQEMCSAPGRGLLAEFFGYVLAEHRRGGGATRIVLNGDIVDFLAVMDDAGGWTAFATEAEALRKFRDIERTTEEVWRSLREAVAGGVALTLLVGNHDVELSFPLVRAELLRAVGAGEVEFIYDNQAYRLGPLLIEHGNRYDTWNVVAHDSLRRMRSRASRGAPATKFPTQPGSELVARVMNQIKADYGFVDLLKPETRGVLPILAALDKGVWKKAWPAVYAAARAAWRSSQYDNEGQPTDNDFVADEHVEAGPRPDHSVEDAAAVATAESGYVPVDEFPYRADFEDALAIADSPEAKNDDVAADVDGLLPVGALLSALRSWSKKDSITWNVEREAEAYEKPARALADRGAEVVVFGHTHLAKRVALGDKRYLNTGTWADLMRLGPDILEGDAAAGEKELRGLLEKLRANDIGAMRRPVPTFARIELEDDCGGHRIVASDVHFFDGGNRSEPISTGGLVKRLGIEPR